MATDRNEELRSRAYRIWESEGRPEGMEAEHWARAERELAAEADGDSAAFPSAAGAAPAAAAKRARAKPAAAPAEAAPVTIAASKKRSAAAADKPKTARKKKD